MQTTKGRLIAFLEYRKLSQAKFAEAVGLSKGYVGSMTENPTQETLAKIRTKFPDLNIDWFLTGEGEMLKKEQQTGDISASTVVGANFSGSGNQITNNDIKGMIELQKGYQEMIKTSQAQLSESQSQINRLIAIIEQYNK